MNITIIDHEPQVLRVPIVVVDTEDTEEEKTRRLREEKEAERRADEEADKRYWEEKEEVLRRAVDQ